MRLRRRYRAYAEHSAKARFAELYSETLTPRPRAEIQQAFSRAVESEQPLVVTGPNGPGIGRLSRLSIAPRRIPSKLNVLANRKVALALSARQAHRKERHYYASKVLATLPRTKMTKRRQGQMGQGLFARNSLKQPRTRVGLRNLLLPPIASIDHIAAQQRPGLTLRGTDFAKKALTTVHPQF